MMKRYAVGNAGFAKAQLGIRQQKLYSPCRAESYSDGGADERSVCTWKPGHQICSLTPPPPFSLSLRTHTLSLFSCFPVSPLFPPPLSLLLLLLLL